MNIEQFGTLKQVEIYREALKHGYRPFVRPRVGMVAAAKALGMDRALMTRQLAALECKAAAHMPEIHDITKTGGTPEGYPIKGTSGLYKVMEDGSKVLALEWIKTNRALADQLDTMRVFIEDFIGEQPRIQVPDAPVGTLDTDIIPWFNIGDGHLGMLAHEWEVGHNFDLKMAEQELLLAMAIQIQRAPNCQRCVIQDMGDMTHYENIGAKTDRSGHDLDFDGRFGKMIHVYAKVMRQIVEMALEKFQYVDVIVNQGNHSRTNDLWMAVFLRHVYEGAKDRLTVLDNNSVFIPYRMGNTFVMSHHSDICKPRALAEVMVTDFRQDHGETLYHYIDIGHVHHGMVVKEHPSVIVESFNQLAPSDKHAHDGGWRSRSFLTTVLRSKTYGETGRWRLTAEEVKDRLHNLAPGTSANTRRTVHTV